MEIIHSVTSSASPDPFTCSIQYSSCFFQTGGQGFPKHVKKRQDVSAKDFPPVSWFGATHEWTSSTLELHASLNSFQEFCLRLDTVSASVITRSFWCACANLLQRRVESLRPVIRSGETSRNWFHSFALHLPVKVFLKYCMNARCFWRIPSSDAFEIAFSTDRRQLQQSTSTISRPNGRRIAPFKTSMSGPLPQAKFSKPASLWLGYSETTAFRYRVAKNVSDSTPRHGFKVCHEYSDHWPFWFQWAENAFILVKRPFSHELDDDGNAEPSTPTWMV